MKSYFTDWCEYRNKQLQLKMDNVFQGIKLTDIDNLKQCFNVKIMIYSLNPNGIVKMVYNSLSSFSDKMYLNLRENHMSYITNFKSFAKKFQCEKCEKLFKREWSLKRHSNCFHRTNDSFPGGFHKTPATIFEKIRSLNIHVDENICYFRKFVVWDMEAILIKNTIKHQISFNGYLNIKQ